MSVTFEEVMAIVSTLLLLPAMVVLIGYAARHPTFGGEHWDPRRCPERDWWDGRDADEEPT